LGCGQRGGFVVMALLLQLRDALRAQRVQRIVVDAGQIIYRQRILFVRLQVEQQQRLRRRIVVADVGACVFGFGIAGIVDVMHHHRMLAALVRLRHRHRQQPARIGRERGHHHPHLVAKVKRRRGARGIFRVQLVVVFAHRVLVGLVRTQGREQAELQALHLVGLGFGRVVFHLQRCRRSHHARRRIPDEPVVVLAPAHELTVGGDLQAELAGVVAGDLACRAAGDVAHEDVAVANERRAIVRVVEDRGTVRAGEFGAAQFVRRAAFGGDAVQVLDRRALALQFEVNAAAVHAPVFVLHRRPDPVGIGHDLFEREFLGRARGGCGCCILRRGGGDARAYQQANQAGNGDAIHGRDPRTKARSLPTCDSHAQAPKVPVARRPATWRGAGASVTLHRLPPPFGAAMSGFRILAGLGIGLLSSIACAQTTTPTTGAGWDQSLIDTRHEIPAMPPPTVKHDVTETFFGSAVHDPYRWLEEADAPAVKQWIAVQNAYTEKVMDGFTDAKAIAKRVGELALTSTQQFDPEIVGGTLFYMRQTPPQPQAALVAQGWPNGKARVLVDPNAMAGTPAITDFWPSPDGKYVGYGTAEGGNEETTIRFIDVATGKTLPDALPHAGGGTTPQALVWDADGKGVTYVRLPSDVPSDQSQFNAALYHHVLGSDANNDALEFGKGLSKVA